MWKGQTGRLCLSPCLEATTTTLVTPNVVGYFPSPSLVFQSYRRKVGYNYLKR